MGKMPDYYGVVYDSATLEPRRIIVPSDPFSISLFNGTHAVEPGEKFCTVHSRYVEHLFPDLMEMAKHAVRRHVGKP